MDYRPIIHEFSAFQYDGDLMDSKGKWYVPDWAVYMYQKGQLYFYAEKPFLPPTELYYKKDESSVPIHIKYGDYVIKLHDGVHTMDKETFEVLFNEV